MVTKSITTTEQELKELMKKSFFQRAEPVKEGEIAVDKIIHDEKKYWYEIIYIFDLKKTGNHPWGTEYTLKKALCQVGDVFSVKNKKGGFAWFSKSNNISFLKNNKPFPEFEKAGWKPLLVRLNKIEEKTETQLLCNMKKYGYLFNDIDKFAKEFWLKTFRRI